MQVAIVFAALFAVASAGLLAPAPLLATAPVAYHAPTVVAAPAPIAVAAVPVATSTSYKIRAPAAKLAVVSQPAVVAHAAPVLLH